jgi:hypothetical protein
MTPFQGDSKKRSDSDINELIESLSMDGLLQPFSLWKKEDKLFILDGHGRFEALVKMIMKDPSILEQDMPINLIEAETEEEAIKACLQCMSTYGKINRAGVVKFSSPVVNYKAPVVKHVAPRTAAAQRPPVDTENIIVRLKVQKDKVRKLTQLLSQVNGVEVI